MHQDSRWTRAPVLRSTALLFLAAGAVALSSTGVIAGSKSSVPLSSSAPSVLPGGLGPDSYFLRMWGWGVDDGTSDFQVCTRDCQAGDWGSGVGQLYNPRGLALDPTGRVAVVDQYNYRVQFFSADGAYLSQYGSSGPAELQFGKPRDIAFDTSGNAYIADTNNQRVQVIDSSGTFVRTWGWGVDTGTPGLQTCTSSCQAGIQGSGNGQFYDPAGIFVTAAGHVWVADMRNNRLQRFDQYGTYQDQIGAGGSATLANPTDLADDGQGNFVILDEGNHRIVRRRMSDYGFVDMWGWGVLDGASRLQVCTSSCQVGLQGNGEGQFGSITGVAVDRKRGLIYISDVNNDRVNIFNTAGSYVGLWGSNGSAEGQFSHAAAVATDSSGHVYVTDEQNNRVQKHFLGTLNIIVADSPVANPSALLAPPAHVFTASRW